MVKEEKLEKYENKSMSEEVKEDLIENDTFDLTNEEELKELEKELNTSNYFKPEADLTYKIELTTTFVQRIERDFEDQETKEKKTIIKYVLGVKTISSKGDEFEGTWEVGRMILNQMIKDFKVGNVFKLTKTGSGLKTKYNIIKDF